MLSQLPRGILHLCMGSFMKQIEDVEKHMDILVDRLVKITDVNEELKSVATAYSMQAIRMRLDGDLFKWGRIAFSVKPKLEGINIQNLTNRRKTFCGKGTPVDRMRMDMTNCLNEKFKDLVTKFQTLRRKTYDDYRETVERRVMAVIGCIPDEEFINKLIETGNSEQIFDMAIQGKGQVLNVLEKIQETNNSFRKREKSFCETTADYLDALDEAVLFEAVLFEAQAETVASTMGEVRNAAGHVNMCTSTLPLSKSLQKKSNKFMIISITWPLFIAIIWCFLW